MLVNNLLKSPAKVVVGIDASTTSLAFCVYHDGIPVKWGKVNIDGADIYEKINDASHKSKALFANLDADYICIEAAVKVASTAVAIKLGYIFGAIIAQAVRPQTRVLAVPPISWQSYIGNKNYTAKQKADLMAEFPGKSPTWIKSEIRRRRKQYTMAYFSTKYNIQIADNDVGDAFGIGYYAVENFVK